MSQQALRAATGASSTEVATAARSEPKTIAGLLVDPRIKEQMALALPKHLTADRLARIALTEVRKNPKLAQCDQASFLGAVMQCAALGLEPGGALGHAYLIPFKNNRKNITEVQFLVGYRGMIDLARRSGQIQSLEARCVYEKDKFSVSLGLDSNLTHEPDWTANDRGKLTFVYAVAKLKDGGIQFDVMSRAEIEKVRTRSRSSNDGPWVTDYDEMAKKTIVRRLFKYLPVSIEMQRAVGLDEQASMGLAQDNPLTIDYAPTDPALLSNDDAGTTTISQNEAAGISFEEVEMNLRAAGTRESLEDAADLIRDVSDSEERSKLNALYNTRLAVIESR